VRLSGRVSERASVRGRRPPRPPVRVRASVRCGRARPSKVRLDDGGEATGCEERGRLALVSPRWPRVHAMYLYGETR